MFQDIYVNIRKENKMSKEKEFGVNNFHGDLNNLYMYLEEHFDRVSYDSDSDAIACNEDIKLISKRLKKLDKIEKILDKE